MADVTAPRRRARRSTRTRRSTTRPTLGKGGTLNAVGAVCFAISAFALVTILTRSLGARGAGAFLESVAVFSILSRTSVLGADIGLVRFVSRYRGSTASPALRPMIAIALVPVLAVAGAHRASALFVVADPLGRLIGDAATEDQVATYLRLMAPFIPVAARLHDPRRLRPGLRHHGPVGHRRADRPPAPRRRLLVLGTVVAGTGTTALALSWATPWAIGFVATSVWVTAAAHPHRAGRHAREPAPRSPARSPRRFWRFSIPRSLGALLQHGHPLGRHAPASVRWRRPGRPASTPRRPAS